MARVPIRNACRGTRAGDGRGLLWRPAPSVHPCAGGEHLDTEDRTLLYVFTPARGGGRKGKVAVRPEFSDRLRLPGEARRQTVTTHSVRSAGYVDAANLRESRYRPLAGAGADE